MKIHHVGIIVENVEKNIKIYAMLGYTQVTEVLTDNIQHLRICFLQSQDGGQTIELIESGGSMSSIHNFKSGYHHICYDVSDYKDFFNYFRALKIGKIFTKPITAPALDNSQVVFACLNNGMFVEFILSR